MPSQPLHDRIDETIHQRTRLAIMATLAAVEELDFNDLKAQLTLSDGNLSTHLTTLEQAGYIGIHKSFRGRKPRTTVQVTDKGRKALASYVNLLERILGKTK
jgi:DNA-binding MarR family transcriptional regulator